MAFDGVKRETVKTFVLDKKMKPSRRAMPSKPGDRVYLVTRSPGLGERLSAGSEAQFFREA